MKCRFRVYVDGKETGANDDFHLNPGDRVEHIQPFDLELCGVHVTTNGKYVLEVLLDQDQYLYGAWLTQRKKTEWGIFLNDA